ncbi:MAG: glycosyl transferase family 1, partial [Clostridia bacterium]|nr:glycosyl transferase family 1 [Clostridia bacterium]
MARILYAASVIGHIDAFHTPYIDALRSGGHTVTVMANGEGADINIPFEKKIFSGKNRACRKMIREAVRRGDFDAII